MSKIERKQKLQLCISTLERLNGCMPGTAELCDALGWEYVDVVLEWVEENTHFHRL